MFNTAEFLAYSGEGGCPSRIIHVCGQPALRGHLVVFDRIIGSTLQCVACGPSSHIIES